MSIQPYKDSTSVRELELVQARVTPEEAEKRQREADELDVKLRRIIEEVPDNEYSRMGSNAGANSKTFDQYRFAKQRELERVKKMEAEAAAEEKKRQFQDTLEKKNAAEDAKTAARRAKRQKAKQKKQRKSSKEGVIPKAAKPSEDQKEDQPDLD